MRRKPWASPPPPPQKTTGEGASPNGHAKRDELSLTSGRQRAPASSGSARVVGFSQRIRGLWYCATAMDLSTTKRLLEGAILEVAKSEYTRLSAGMGPHQVARHVERALDSLGGLRHGIAPEYNEWDALFYLTWYQPRQVNLTHLVAAHLFSAGPGSFHIIDFGCGALASRFAFAVSAAMLDVPPSEIHVDLHGIDKSGPMMRIGNAMWSKFVGTVTDPRLAAACRAMDYTTYVSYEGYRVSPAAHTPRVHQSASCYLLAIHTIYESNKDALRKIFSAIQSEREPAATIITSVAAKEHVASQAAGGGFRRLSPRLEKLWRGGLPNVTQWRRHLANQLTTADPIVRNFLRPEVKWKPPQSETRVLMSL